MKTSRKSTFNVPIFFQTGVLVTFFQTLSQDCLIYQFCFQTVELGPFNQKWQICYFFMKIWRLCHFHSKLTSFPLFIRKCQAPDFFIQKSRICYFFNQKYRLCHFHLKLRNFSLFYSKVWSSLFFHSKVMSLLLFPSKMSILPLSLEIK